MIKISLKIGIISAGKEVSLFYKNQLKYFFADAVEVYSYSMEDDSAYSPKTEDVFLVTTVSFDRYNEILDFIPKEKPIITGSVTIKNNIIETLKKYPEGTKALLVNSSAKMAAETIVLLYQRGINNIEFYPYYPGCSEVYQNISLAITPAEKDFVPKYIKEIVDIGHRVLDTNTILEIAAAADCEYLLETERLLNYFDEISESNQGIESLISKTELLKQQFNIIMDVIKTGIIITDKKNNIISCSPKASKMLEKPHSSLLYKPVCNIIPENIFERCKKEKTTLSIVFENQNGKKLNISAIPIIKNNRYQSGLGIITNFGEEDKIKSELSNKIIKKGHRAKYTFEDIITKNTKMLQTIKMAKKMAETNSSILITGESGTGKELFAHSIHNHSPRKNNPFVAINCAALTDTLLESELFGYEEGAFTGAKKGGKIGLFEIADGGTIFLDEIEGMSRNLQFKLLRVIQEKEIIKIGGDKMIPIDVRIIAASNENISSLVENKVFRQDLYYRLNTLPLNIPPLRERMEDIPFIVEIFKYNLNFNFAFSEQAKQLLYNYNWPGNIRELRNCIEFIYCLGEKIIEPSMLPQYITENSKEKLILNYSFNKNKKDILKEILTIILEYESKGKVCGRKTIFDTLIERDFYISEAQIRKILENFKKDGYITSSKGRGGSKVTELGIKKFNI